MLPGAESRTGKRRVAVVTESVPSLGQRGAGREIAVIPIPFSYAGSDYLDDVNVTPDEF